MAREFETLFHCDTKTSIKLFVEEEFPHWNQIIHGPHIFQIFIQKLCCFKIN